MTKTMTFLLASTALTIALGATAWSATRIMDDEVLPTAVQSQMDSRDLSPLIFVNDDDDEDDDDDDEDEKPAKKGKLSLNEIRNRLKNKKK